MKRTLKPVLIDLDEEYRLAADVAEATDGDRRVLRNPAQGSRVATGRMTTWILENYRSPRPLRALQRELSDDENVPASGLVALVEHLILVPVASAHILDDGLLAPPAGAPIGTYRNIVEAVQVDERVDFAVVGVGCSMGGGIDSSAHHGPTAIRSSFRPSDAFALAEKQAEAAVPPSDEALALLDLELGRSYPSVPPVVDFGDLLIAQAATLEDAHLRLELVIDRVLAAGLRPLTLGGDHSITWPILRSLLKVHERIGIIHFDAHHDLFEQPRGRINHANPFRFALQRPEVAVLHQVGLRTNDRIRPSRLLHDARVSYASAFRASRSTPEQVFERLPRDLPYYLTFDLDCLEPALCGNTDTPEPGGLSFYTALELVDYAVRHLPLIGADFVEVGGPPSADNPGARSVAALVLQVLLSSAPFEPITSHVDASHAPAIAPSGRKV